VSSVVFAALTYRLRWDAIALTFLRFCKLWEILALEGYCVLRASLHRCWQEFKLFVFSRLPYHTEGTVNSKLWIFFIFEYNVHISGSKFCVELSKWCLLFWPFMRWNLMSFCQICYKTTQLRLRRSITPNLT
jgi:hypothetical protein